MIGAWREKSLRPVWSPTVVVGAVLGKYGPQLPFTEDQDAVGEFGSGCLYESFGEADLDGVDARVGQDGVERRGELAGPVADEEPEGGGMVVEVHQQVPGLLGGPGSGRLAGRPEDVHVAIVDFQDEEDVDPLERHRAVDVEEVHGRHGRGLRPQKLSPCGIGGPGWCRRYPPLLGDPADRGCSDAVAELEQFALDSFVAPGSGWFWAGWRGSGSEWRVKQQVTGG
jgi:hypothetical protein